MGDTAIIVGGTQGIGLALAKRMLARGDSVVITGRDLARTKSVAATLGERASAAAFDLSQPHEIDAALAGLRNVRHVVISAIERDSNTVRDYNIEKAIRLTTIKVVGYTAVVHALLPNLTKNASIVLFGGLAKERPYPGSTTVTAVNGAVTSMVRTLGTELAPIRVNALHPGIIGDTPAWQDKEQALEAVRARTPIGRLATTDEVTHATLFLLDNEAINGINLNVDGGWLMG